MNEGILNSNIFANHFYGTADHYLHPGWYFDLIINDLNELTACRNVRPGRFICVTNESAVFMRCNDDESYYFIKPKNGIYLDPQRINGLSVTECAGDSDKQAFIDSHKNIIEKISGFRFIAYTNRIAQILLENGTLSIDVDDENKDILYSIAPQSQAENIISLMASYYFPSES